MKTRKLTILTCVFVLISTNLFSQAISDTTFHYRDKTIQVKDSLDEVRVKVSKSDSFGYVPVYEGIFTNERQLETYTVGTVFNIDTPFGSLLGRDRPGMQTHWQGMGAGLSFMMNTDLAYRPFASGEIILNPLEISSTFVDQFALVTGIGVVYRDYALEKNLTMEKVDGVVRFEKMHTDIYSLNSVRQIEFVVPLLFEWQPKSNLKHKFFLSCGALFSYGTDRAAMHVTREKDQDLMGRGLDVRLNNLDIFGQIGFGSVSLYAKYTPYGIFQSQKGPKFSQLSIGLMAYFNE
jgi:hypothetical protein